MVSTSASSYITFTVGQLVNATQEAPPGASNMRIEIPRFQRSLVWSDEQRTNLIESIHRGYPIGSLLLYKRANPKGEGELFQVVDGLQRTSTLVAYAKKPLAFAPITLFPSKVVTSVANLLGTDESHVQRVVSDWMKETEELSSVAGFTSKKLAKRLLTEFEKDSHADIRDQVEDLLDPGLDALRGEVDIKGIPVAVVTYNGDEADLPDIFERINQRGTKLNKYEVFAATWLNSETNVSSPEIRAAINNKYASLLNEGYSINGLERDKSIQDFNLFEYLFGFGKVLVGSYPLLFSEPGNLDPTTTEPAAFSLSCVVRGQQLSEMKRLNKFMPKDADDLIDPTIMEAALLEAAAAVESWLRPFIGLKLNSQTSSVDLAHGELQIVSMIARAAVGRWDTRGDWSEVPGWQKDWDDLRTSMRQHYLMDLLEETWRGPIYSLMFNRVWDSNEGSSESTGPSPYYARPIAPSTWDNALDAWFDKQLAREQRTRPYVRALDRVFLRYVYTGLVSHLDDKDVTFELEHLFPVSRLKEEIPADSPGWPISCVANLALFTKALNREKTSQTISEYLSKNSLPHAEKKRLDKYLLCAVQDVDIPDDGLSQERYVTFLRSRWGTMKAALLANLGMSGESVPHENI